MKVIQRYIPIPRLAADHIERARQFTEVAHSALRRAGFNPVWDIVHVPNPFGKKSVAVPVVAVQFDGEIWYVISNDRESAVELESIAVEAIEAAIDEERKPCTFDCACG